MLPPQACSMVAEQGLQGIGSVALSRADQHSPNHPIDFVEAQHERLTKIFFWCTAGKFCSSCLWVLCDLPKNLKILRL